MNHAASLQRRQCYTPIVGRKTGERCIFAIKDIITDSDSIDVVMLLQLLCELFRPPFTILLVNLERKNTKKHFIL